MHQHGPLVSCAAMRRPRRPGVLDGRSVHGWPRLLTSVVRNRRACARCRSSRQAGTRPGRTPCRRVTYPIRSRVVAPCRWKGPERIPGAAPPERRRAQQARTARPPPVAACDSDDRGAVLRIISFSTAGVAVGETGPATNASLECGNGRPTETDHSASSSAIIPEVSAPRPVSQAAASLAPQRERQVHFPCSHQAAGIVVGLTTSTPKACTTGAISLPSSMPVSRAQSSARGRQRDAESAF